VAGIVAILIGAALVFFLFPRHDDEKRLLAAYHAEDATRTHAPAGATPSVPAESG
jgi:hypothetical protein